MAWVNARNDWSPMKRRCYIETILQQLGPGLSDWRGSFMAMVKSGECYFGDELKIDKDGFLIGRKDRPRNIFNPCQRLCGFTTAFQSLLW